MKKQEGPFHKMRPGAYVRVWMALVILTGITVSVAGMDLGGASIPVVLLVAAVKSGLVLSFFMHLKDEKGLLFRLIVPGTLALIVLFIGIVFTDLAFR